MRREDYSPKRAPWFDGSYYSSFSVKMKAYLQALETDVWNPVKSEYTPPKGQPKRATVKRIYRFHAISKNEILDNLFDVVMTKVEQQISAKKIWDSLEISYSKETPMVEAPAIIVKEKGDSFKYEEMSKGKGSIDSSDEGSM